MFLDCQALSWASGQCQWTSRYTLFAHQLGLFRRDLSLVADLEDGQTFVERLRAGARWVIPKAVGDLLTGRPAGCPVSASCVGQLRPAAHRGSS